MKLKEANMRENQAENHNPKLFLKEVAPQPFKTKWKDREHIYSSQDVNYIEIESTILIMIPKLCAKETCRFALFSPKTRKFREREREKDQSMGIYLLPRCMLTLYLVRFSFNVAN